MLVPLQLDHVALPIFDAAASLRFYGELLELPLVDTLVGDDWGGKPWLMMIFEGSDGRQLALCALRGATPPASSELPNELRHVAFRCGTHVDLAAWRERLTRHDIKFTEEDHGTQQSLYFEDPNGIVIEVTTARSAPTKNLAAHDLARAWIEG